MNDAALGQLLLVFGVVAYVYYTLWALGMVRLRLAMYLSLPACLLCLIFFSPATQAFIDQVHVAHSYFPPREYVPVLPASVLVLLVTVTGSLTACAMMTAVKRR